MKYLCLIYHDPDKLAALSANDYNIFLAETVAYTEEMCQRGYCDSADALVPLLTAISIRVHGDGLSITDGPYLKATEQLGSYLLIEARDLNEAIRVASKVPPARMGGIEIRPVSDSFADQSRCLTNQRADDSAAVHEFADAAHVTPDGID